MKLRKNICEDCCKGKRISELDEKVDIQGTEYIPFQEGDDNGKLSLGSLKDYLIKLIEEYLINNGIIREDWVQSEPAYKLLATLPELIADRACKDEFGNNINDTYLTREAVKEYIGSIYEDLFVNNPPQILDGFITVDMLSDAVLQLLNSGGAITNFPDDEDITVKDGKLKFKDKAYDPNNYSGVGRTMLRKNMVDGVNVLTQEMISEPNQIYIIQYDYDLRGETITIPDNSILWYLGGSLNNGTITSNSEDPIIVWGKMLGDVIIDIIIVTNKDVPADEEDITSETGELKFADKIYDTSSFSGLGRIYLRKNIVGNKNILTQEMISKSNTRYIIQYDYDLNGQTVNIPENCVLEFEGGSICNGTLNGNSTIIRCSELYPILLQTTITGTWLQNNIYSDWFVSTVSLPTSASVSESAQQDDINIFRNLMTLASSQEQFTHVYIQNRTFNVSLCDTSVSLVDYKGIVIPSNTYIHNSGTIQALPTDIEKTAIFLVYGDSNITIDGGKLIGDVQTHTGTTGEWGYGISLVGASNVIIKNIEIVECWGDGINIQAKGTSEDENDHCRNILIDNVKCLRNRRQGMSIEGCIGAIVRNSEFSDTGSIVSTAPSAGIDIEPWYDAEIATDIVIDNCKLYNNKTYLIIWSDNNSKGITVNNCFSDRGIWIRSSNVAVNNFQCTEGGSGYLAIWGTCHNIKVTNSNFTNEIYGQGDLQNILIDNCNFNMSTSTWSGFAINFENANDTCVYKDITISNCSFKDTEKIRFLYARSTQEIDINFKDNFVVTACTQPFEIGCGDFLNNKIIANKANGILLNNLAKRTINVSNSSFQINRYVDYIFTLSGDIIFTEDTFDYILSNVFVSVSSCFRVSNSNNYRVLVNNSNLGGDLVSILHLLPNWVYKNTTGSTYSKEYTPVIQNATEGKCYSYVLPYKRGSIKIFTSNLYTTKNILYNTVTEILVNPNIDYVDINPTRMLSTETIIDDSNNTEFPKFAYDIVDDTLKLYITNGANSVYGLKTKVIADYQDNVDYSNIKYQIVDMPQKLNYICKLQGTLVGNYSGSVLDAYTGMEYINRNGQQIFYNGLEWANSDGTLTSKVTII